MFKRLLKSILTISLLASASMTSAATFIVPQGGTGQATLPSGALLVGNGVNAVTSTSSPVVGVVTATSTTATSTFANGINLTKGCFAVNSICLTSGSGTTDFIFVNGALTPSTTKGLILNASSSITDFNALRSTTSAATTTNLFTSELSIASLSGFLKATAGKVAAALVDLTTDVTGTLPAANGGTGKASYTSGDLIYAVTPTSLATLASSTGGTVLMTDFVTGRPSWVATSSLGITSGAGGNTFGQVFELFESGAYIAPTTTKGAIISASSTIGSGAQAGGLTISGWATTTGSIIVQGAATSTFTAGIQASALNITGATSTFANGIQLASGCYRMPDGTCAGAGSGSGTVGTGTAGQFPFYQANGTTLTATSSLFITQPSGSTQGLIGVGTSSPWATLSVNPVAGHAAAFAVGSSSKPLFTVRQSAGQAFVGINTASPAGPLDIFQVNSTEQLRLSKSAALYASYTVDSTGDLSEAVAGGDIYNLTENRWICAGGSCPALTATSTAGNVFVEEAVTWGNGFNLVDTSATVLGLFNAAGIFTGEFTATAWNAALKLGVGSTTPTGNFGIEQGTETYSLWAGNQGSTTPSIVVMGVNGNGAVGIGTSTPQAQLALGTGAFYVPQYDVSTTTGVTQIYPKNGNDQRMRYGNSALNVNINQAPAGFKLILELCGPSAGTGGAITLTGSSTLLWKGGTAWTQTTTANKCDTVTFRFTNASSTPVIEAIAATNF